MEDKKSLNEIARAKKAIEATTPKDFEKVLLGTLLVAENPYLYYSVMRSKVTASMFSDDLQDLAAVIFYLIETNQPLRKFLILKELKGKDIAVSSDDITQIMNSHAEGEEGKLPSDDEFSDLCTTFVEAWYTFSINQSAVQFATDLQNGTPSIVACRELYARNESIDNIKVGISDTEDNSLFAAAAKYIEIVERRKNDPNFMSGLQSGIIGIDTRTGGFEEGDLIGVCGFAGKGKTTIVHQIVSFIAKQKRVVSYSLEESPLNLAAKSLSANTGVSTIDMKHGQISDDELKDLKDALTNIASIQMSVIDNIFHIDELERSITLQVKKNGAKCIVIDNLTIIQHNYKGNRDDNETKITYRLKAIAKKLKVSIFVLVHQNKDSTGRADRKPTTTDIKFAGGGVAFDIVLFPYTSKENDVEHELNIETSIEITKNRGGGMCGTVPLVFARNWGLYCEYYEDEDSIKHPILPKQPTKIEDTEGDKKPSNIIKQRGNVEDKDLPF